MILEKLKNRIKGSKIYEVSSKGIRRLYFPYSRGTAKMKVNTWFEVVNDKLQLFCRVSCENQHYNWEKEKEKDIIEEMYNKFYEIINDCEEERKKVPLDVRLSDDIVPVHQDSMLHQAQALRFCCSMKASALFADTGTGKSKIAIDLAQSRYEAGQINKVLIFCPVSTKKNFQDEINKWEKHNDLEWKIVGLESMSQSEMTVLNTLEWADSETMIVVDESHLCKTPTALRSVRIKACCDKTSYKLIMTGTPAESVKDMYMQYSLLSDLIIQENSWLTFEDKYLITDQRGDIIGYKNVDHLMSLLEPYTYQVTKEEVLTLPSKRFETIHCDLTEAQQYEYDKLKTELLEKLDAFENEYVPSSLIFKYFGLMQQVSCGFISNNEDLRDLGSCKYEAVKATNYNDGQSIFFCKYLYELDKLVEFLGRENCAVFTGMNREDRDAEKDEFTSGKRKYFVATMGSGGIGLNGLQQCNRIIFWSNSFKYTERKQCIGRIDRKGQEREMFIYDISPNCGIEKRINQNLSRKGNLSDEIKSLLKDKTKLKNYIKKL